MEENRTYDLFQNYVSDLNKAASQQPTEATAEDLSKAMALYAGRNEAALASLMEQAAICGAELEAAGAVTGSNQFRGLPANADLSDVDNGRVARTPTNADKLRISTAAEHAVVGRSGSRERGGSQAAASPLDSTC